MGKVETFEGVRVETLPDEMRARLGLEPGALVNVSVTREDVRPVDKERLHAIIAEFHALPVLDDRDHADMLYDDDGLPK